MELHYTNKLLPETIKVALQQDNENLVYDLLQTIDGINSISNELEAKTVGKLARQLITLKSLKYQLTVRSSCRDMC